MKRIFISIACLILFNSILFSQIPNIDPGALGGLNIDDLIGDLNIDDLLGSLDLDNIPDFDTSNVGSTVYNSKLQSRILYEQLDTLIGTTFSPALAGSTDMAAEILAREAPFAIGSGNVHSMGIRAFPGLNFGLGVGVTLKSLDYTEILGKLSSNIETLTSSMGDISLESGEVSSDLFVALANITTSLPTPYFSLYFKMGLPEIMPFIKDYPIDFGLRLGFIPNAGSLLASNSELHTFEIYSEGFNIGFETRMQLLNVSFFYIDARVSMDFSYRKMSLSYSMSESGSLGGDGDSILVDSNGDIVYVSSSPTPILISGDNYYSTSIMPSMTYSWSGMVFSPRIFAGIDIPIFGGVYFGAGPDINIGNVDMLINMQLSYSTTVENIKYTGSSLYENDVLSDPEYLAAVEDASGTQTGVINANTTITRRAFDLYDLRLITGLQLFFVNISLEYGVVSESFAVTVYPFAFKF